MYDKPFTENKLNSLNNNSLHMSNEKISFHADQLHMAVRRIGIYCVNARLQREKKFILNEPAPIHIYIRARTNIK